MRNGQAKPHITARDNAIPFNDVFASARVIHTLESMSDEQDNPGVIAFPPLLWLIGAIVSVLVHFGIGGVRMLPYSVSLILAIGCLIAGPTLAISALRIMRAAGTNVDPREPTLTIVRTGPYRFTRNPMYLALCLVQAAIGFLLNDAITVLFAVLLGVILHFGVVRREERYLEGKFGEQYLELKRTVRRWF